MILKKAIILTIIFHVLKSVECAHSEVFCQRNLIDSNNATINETTYCKTKPCLINMCKENEVSVLRRRNGALRRLCTNINDIPDLDLTLFQAVYKYDDAGKLQKTNKTIWEAFNVVRYQDMSLLRNPDCFLPPRSWTTVNGIEYKPHFLENGSLVIQVVNETRYLSAVTHYLVWFQLPENVKKYTTLSLKLREITIKHEEGVLFYAIGMFVSCFFMILVLVVYGTLKELQNIVGLILMAFMGTLTFGFLFKASQTIGLYYNVMTVYQCKIISPMTTFLQVSSFTWMNVLSFDIWWKFRSTYYNRATNRRGIWNKFFWYALYAWGSVLLLIVTEVIIDNLDLPQYNKLIKPKFSKCTIGTSIWYFVVPVTTVLSANLVLFVLTAFNIWRVRKEMSRFNKTETKKNKENESMFVLCLKLSVLTGTSWIFEVLSHYEALPEWIMVLANIYNALIGVILFAAFVFKTRILLKLCRKFSIDNHLTRMLENRMNRTMKTTESDNSTGVQEIQLGDSLKVK